MPSPPDTDRELIERARTDPDAFGTLFERHFDRIFGYLLRRTGDWDLARDLTSEVFLQALQHVWRFRWRGIPVSAWFYAIATNQLRMHFRRRQRATRLLDRLTRESGLAAFDTPAVLAERASAQRDLEQAHEFERVRRALATLPVKEQDVIALRFFEQKSGAEIAQILGKREGTIRSLLSRGLARLRGALGATQQNPDRGIS
jgi:RNA polymerase sigma-70 factor (ECF subfamily)